MLCKKKNLWGITAVQRLCITCLICLIPIVILSQDKKEEKTVTTKKSGPISAESKVPAQAVVTDIFSFKNISFNKKTDPQGRGEVLEVDMEILNNTDLTRELYIFVLAAYDNIIWQWDSFAKKKLYPKDVNIEYFVPYPLDVKNFEYTSNGKTKIIKYPKNIKAGVNPKTGKPFSLKDRLYARTLHLSKYRKNFRFFNSVVIYIFDDDEKLLFYQVYHLKGTRR